MYVDFSLPASIEMQRRITETILQTTKQLEQSQIITHESLCVWRTREQNRSLWQSDSSETTHLDWVNHFIHRTSITHKTLFICT